MIDQAELTQIQENLYDSDKLARILVDHITNEKGEILARVWENPGFQEIYDYKGVLKQRRRLERKQEQVYNQLDASKQLFQKVYYNPQLLKEDELQLRHLFVKYNDHHESSKKLIQGSMFVAYWPLTYYLSRSVKPKGVLLWSLFYYFGAYRYGALNFTLSSLQRNLNRVAEPFAQKYGIKALDKYAEQPQPQ